MKRHVIFLIGLYLTAYGLIAQELEWEQRYEFLPPTSIVQGFALTENHEIAILASQAGGPNADGILLFADENGDTIWTRDLTSNFWANSRSPIEIDSDPKIVLAGSRHNEVQDTVLAEMQAWDFLGGFIYRKVVPTGKNETIPRDLLVGESNFLFCASHNVGEIGLENLLRFHLIKFDNLGQIIWHKSFRDSTASLERSVSIIKYGGGFTLRRYWRARCDPTIYYQNYSKWGYDRK